MRRIKYDELSTMSTAEISQITASKIDFIVCANQRTGRHLRRFVDNDNAYRTSDRRLKDRFAFVAGGWHGFFVLDFLHLWSRAGIDGYEVVSGGVRESNDEVRFVYPRATP